MKFIEADIKGVWIIEPQRFGDQRGYFCETFREDSFRENIGEIHFMQDNESVSSCGVLRGLHMQRGKYSQAKLVRVSQGRVVDVAVDLRSDSPTRGQYVMVELSQENGRQLFVPRGFAHGFLVLSDTAQFQYKVDNLYAPKSELTLRYDDPSLGIAWPLDGMIPLLSEKDTQGLTLEDVYDVCEF